MKRNYEELKAILNEHNADIETINDFIVDEDLNEYKVKVLYNGYRYTVMGRIGEPDGCFYSTETYVDFRDVELGNVCTTVVAYFAD